MVEPGRQLHAPPLNHPRTTINTEAQLIMRRKSLLLSRLASSLKISLFFIRENKGKVKPQIRASKRIIFGYGEMILTQKQSEVGKNHGLNCEKRSYRFFLNTPFSIFFSNNAGILFEMYFWT